MNKAAISSVLLPSLLEQIFERFSDSVSGDKKDKESFVLDLHKLLGRRLVPAALHILDYQNIVIYSNNPKTIEVAEICDSRSNFHVIRLFLNINYCTCEYFQQKVLIKETSCTAPFTCHHVLAVRLAIALQHKSLQFKEVPSHTLNLFLTSFLPTNLDNQSLMQHSKHLFEKGILRNWKMLTQSQYSNFKFVGSLNQIKTFTAGIKALSFGENGSFMISEDGFKCVVEQGKCIQASLFIMPRCFSEFYVDGIVKFSINMNILAECLSIFAGIDCSMKMYYKGPEAPLVLVMEPNEEQDISTECSIKTTHYDEPMDFSLNDESSSLNRLFVRGPDLASIFQEFDKSAEELEITISPRRPHFKIDTLGVMQSESSVEVAKTSDMILLFNCRETTKARYKTTLIRMTQKALGVASKVALKTDLSGLLEMHFMMVDPTEAEVYIIFFITPLADIDL